MLYAVGKGCNERCVLQELLSLGEVNAWFVTSFPSHIPVATFNE